MLPKPIPHRHGILSHSAPPVLSFVTSRALEPTRATSCTRRWSRPQRIGAGTNAKLQEHGQDESLRLGLSATTPRVSYQRSGTSQLRRQGGPRIPEYPSQNPLLLSQVLGRPLRPHGTSKYLTAQRLEIGQTIRAYGVDPPSETTSETKSEEDNYLVEDDLDEDSEDTRIFTDPVIFGPRYRTTMRAAHILKTAIKPYSASKHTEQILTYAAENKPMDQLPFLDRWWIQISAMYSAKWDRRLPLELRKQRLDVNASTEQTVNCLLRDGTNYEAIRSVWQDDIRTRLSPEAKRLIFCECLLWILKHRPDVSLNYIQAIGRGQKAMSYILADAFEFVMEYYLERQKPVPPRYHALLGRLMSEVPRLATVISQKLVHGVLVTSSLEQARVFWDTIRSHTFQPSSPTRLVAANVFGLLGDYKKAVNLLHDAIKWGLSPDYWGVITVAKAILRQSAIKAGAHSAGLEIIQFYTQVGIKIDLHFFTILIHNAMEAGDVRTALRFYDRIREIGMEPNDYTYTIILNGLKKVGSEDLASMRVVLVHAMDALPTLERPHYVATEILHHIYLRFFKFQVMDDGRKFMIANKKAFSAVAQSYCEYFDPEPLRYFGIPDEFLTFDKTPSIAMETTAPPMRLTIGAYLHYVAYANPDELPQLFDNFVEKLERRDNPQMAEIIAENHVYNAFLMALCENKSTLGKIPEVLVNMVDKGFHSRPMTSVHTWNILITGFMRHNQLAAVQRVLAIMDDLGEEPNEVTWNSLVQGWLRNEEVEKAVEAMKKMETKRVVLNEKTLREVSASRKGPKIMEAMNRDDEDYLVSEDADESSEESPVETQQNHENEDTLPRKLIKKYYLGPNPLKVPQRRDTWPES